MITIRLVNAESELEGIALLNRRNLRKYISEAEAEAQGFLTAEFDLSYLRTMHAAHPSVIALDGEQVVGYALVATHEVREQHPFHADLFNQIDGLVYKGQPLRGAGYVVVGQLCVDKAYRGIGLVPRLYEHFRNTLRPRHPYAVTDVARANRRSLKAHLSAGFQVIHSMEYGGLEWDVVLWDWRGEPKSPKRSPTPLQETPYR